MFAKKEVPEGQIEFVHDLVWFTVPEKPTVRQQLAYLGAATVTGMDEETFVRLWKGAVALIEDWKCKLLPKLDQVDIDELENPQVAEIIVWVGMKCKKHMNSLDEVPKN